MDRSTRARRFLSAALAAVFFLQSVVPLHADIAFRAPVPGAAAGAVPLIPPSLVPTVQFHVQTLSGPDLATGFRSLTAFAGDRAHPLAGESARVVLALVARPGLAASLRPDLESALGRENAALLIDASQRLHAGREPGAAEALASFSEILSASPAQAARDLDKAFLNARRRSGGLPVLIPSNSLSPVRRVSDDYFEHAGKGERSRSYREQEDEDEGLAEEEEKDPADDPEEDPEEDAVGAEEEGAEDEKADEDGADAAVKKLFQLRDKVQTDALQIVYKELGGDVGDGKLHRDVQRVMRRLTAAAGLPPEAAQVFIGNSFLPNGFTTVVPSEARYLQTNASLAKAFRISNIFISLGLLRSLENEDQLAFVLAHELNHNLKGHLKDFSGAHQVLGHFHELEADAEGLKLLAKAGYRVEGAVDSLYALEREYDRLEKEYSLLGRDKSDVAQAIQRLRDIHPHNDIRRANMLDFMDEAREGFRPGPAVPAQPVWMLRRQSATRPTALDRFEKRMRAAVDLGTIPQGIRAIETFIRHEKAKAEAEGAKQKKGKRVNTENKGQLTMERYAVIEEAYRALVKKVTTAGELRAIELSIHRQRSRAFPSRRLKADLTTRQLDLLIASVKGRPTLMDLLSGPATMSEETRRAGTLRLLGSIRDRRELDAGYKALNDGAESLGLDGSKGTMASLILVEKVATRLWRGARKVLSAELGRAALPEEILAELDAKLSPAWRIQYNDGFAIEILETAFGPEAARSKQFRPSELLLKLMDKPARRPEDGGVEFGLLFDEQLLVWRWGQRHYRPPMVEPQGRRVAYNYERYYVEGLSSPSLEDQLDVLSKFSNGILPPAFIRILRRDGKLEAFQRAAVRALNAQLQRDVEDEAIEEERALSIDDYERYVHGLVTSSLHGLKDFKSIRETVQVIWSEVRPVAAEKGPKAVLQEKEDRSNLADNFFSAMNDAMRRAVVQSNMAGQRPPAEEMRAVAALVSDIEGLLRPFPAMKLAKAYARTLGDNISDDTDYMEAYMLAMPDVVRRSMRYTRLRNWARKIKWEWLHMRLVDFSHWLEGKHNDFYEWLARKRGKRRPLQAIPEKHRVPITHLDFSTFLAIAGDPDLDPRTRLMAAALMDRLDMQGDAMEQRDAFGRVIGLTASAAVGRWMIEDAVAGAKEAQLPGLVSDLLRLSDLHPGLHQPDLAVEGTTENAFREGAVFVRRSEPYRSMGKMEHPFRGVNSRWAETLARRLDDAKAWPKKVEDRLDLMDFMNANGEFSEDMDRRILETSEGDISGFRRWVARDKKRLKRLEGDGHDLESITISTLVGAIPGVPVPKAQPLRIVRNPALRVRLFNLLPEAKLGERPPHRGLREWYNGIKRLWKAYRAAREWFSKEFLDKIQHEGSMEDKVFEILEEVDRIATEEAQQARKDWDKGRRHKREEAVGWDAGTSKEHLKQWRRSKPHQKKKTGEVYRAALKTIMLSKLWELYNAYASTQDPVLGLILDNYPEPTRSRDELLERLIKARALSPGKLTFLESNKSYRQPNPLRIAEKHLLDQAVIQMRKFSPAERVDIILHLAGIKRLGRDRMRAFDKRVLSGDRKKMARDMAAIRSISQLENYMSLMHPKDRGLLLRAQFYGETIDDAKDKAARRYIPLIKAPGEVRRLYEKIVIEGRNLPPFIEKVFRAYFRILNDDEKAKLLSDLASLEDVKTGLTGPEIVKAALRGMGVSGAKVAQVLATHKGLVPPEYAAPLEEFKDRAQDLPKVRVHELVQSRLAALGGGPAGSDKVPPETRLLELSKEALPKLGPNFRQRMLKQVDYLLKAQGRRVRWVEEMGRELGAGSIKVVYKVELDDGRVWVVKTRAPGASYKTGREFTILEELIAELETTGAMKTPGARQLLDEVKALVQAEMDFRDEAAKQTAMMDRSLERPWYSRLLAGAAPKISKPHNIYTGEEVMVEEYMDTTRFADLPDHTLLDRRGLSRAWQAARRGALQLGRLLTDRAAQAAAWARMRGAAAEAGRSLRAAQAAAWKRLSGAAAVTVLVLREAPAAAGRALRSAAASTAQAVRSSAEAAWERLSAASVRTARFLREAPAAALERLREASVRTARFLREAPAAAWAGLRTAAALTGEFLSDSIGFPRALGFIPALFRNVVGPSKASIARMTVREGMLQIVLDEKLEPDPHTGNRHARRGWIWSLLPGLVVMDVGQEVDLPIARLKPWVRAGLALEAGDPAGAAGALLDVVKVPAHRTQSEVEAAITAALAAKPGADLVQRLMDGLLEAEKLGALVLPEYAALEKAFLIYTGYGEWLPKDYIFRSMEKAAAVRLLRDRPMPLKSLLWLGVRRQILGRAAVRAEIEAAFDLLASPKAAAGQRPLASGIAPASPNRLWKSAGPRMVLRSPLAAPTAR